MGPGETSAVPGGSGPKRVQFSSKKCGCPAMGLPDSCGSEGVGGIRGIRGLIWGAGWRAWASCLAHGGGKGGPSLRHLPRGCVRGNGSIVHTRFCSQALFLGCKGAGSLGSQFSTGPENREQRKDGNQGRQAYGFQLKAKAQLGSTIPSSLSSSSPLLQAHCPQMFQIPFYLRGLESAVPSV